MDFEKIAFLENEGRAGSVELESTDDADIVYIPVGRLPSVAVHPEAASSGTVYFTLSPPSVVQAGNANWITWPGGTVSAAYSDGIYRQVTALKLETDTGTCTFEVVF